MRADPDVRVESLVGDAILPVLDDVARLRMEVFREFPYLYDGTAEYEAEYLRSYAASKDALVVVARRGDRVVGASTAMPLTDHSDSVVPPLRDAGFDPSTIYYFGESVLRADHRGLGIGHAFFDHREARARALGRFTHTAFCAVVRPADHPRTPADYVPHDVFWTKRGYVKRAEIVARFAWKDLGEEAETEKPMVFWLRRLPSGGGKVVEP